MSEDKTNNDENEEMSEEERQELKRKLKKEKRDAERKKRESKPTTDADGNTVTNSPGQDFKGGEQVTGTTIPDKDMRTGAPIFDEETDEFGNPKYAESITFEVGANVALDKATSLLLGAPVPGARALYALANIGGSGIINYIAQRIRGTEFSLGELATASGLSLVPGATQAKTVRGALTKGTLRGAATGATQVTAESLIDTGEFATV